MSALGGINLPTSRTPLWLGVFVFQIFFMVPLWALNFLGYLPHWGVALYLGFETCVVSFVLYWVVSRRTSFLVGVCQRRPYEDNEIPPEILARLRSFPWYGCSEVDHVQLALLELMFHHVIRSPAQVGSPSALGRPSLAAHGQWQSARSFHDTDDDRRPLKSARSAEGESDRGFESCVGSYSDNSIGTSPTTNRTTLTTAGSSFDPLGDNAASWEVATTGAKDPGGPIILQLLKSIKIGQSLSTVTLPVHILEARSLLEKLSDQFVHADLLQQFDASGDPYEQLLTVVKWWLAAYHIRPSGAKKPYNPVLGEALCLVFAHPNSTRTVYFAEQVSHHPPVTAMYAKGKGFTYMSLYHPKSQLVSPNCAASIGEGEAVLDVGPGTRKYHFNWPTAYVSGFLAGSARIELGGKVCITDTLTRVKCELEFVRKPTFGGHYDRVVGILHNPEGKPGPYRVEGTWHDTMTLQQYDESPTPFLNANKLPMPRPQAVDIDGHPLQSRAVWQEVTRAIRNGDGTEAARAKHSVEEAQRAVRKQLAERNEHHSPRFFTFAGGVESLHLHAKGSGGSGKGKDALWSLSNWTFTGTDFVDGLESGVATS